MKNQITIYNKPEKIYHENFIEIINTYDFFEATSLPMRSYPKSLKNRGDNNNIAYKHHGSDLNNALGSNFPANKVYYSKHKTLINFSRRRKICNFLCQQFQIIK